MKLFAINADYDKRNKGKSWYYVLSENAKDAKAKFKDRIPWLDIYETKEVLDEDFKHKVMNSPYEYICF